MNQRHKVNMFTLLPVECTKHIENICTILSVHYWLLTVVYNVYLCVYIAFYNSFLFLFYFINTTALAGEALHFIVYLMWTDDKSFNLFTFIYCSALIKIYFFKNEGNFSSRSCPLCERCISSFRCCSQCGWLVWCCE